MSISKQLNRATLNLKGFAEEQVRGTLFSLTSRVIKETPVDTGRLRNNWQSSIGSPLRGELSGVDKTGAGAIRRANSTIANLELGETFYFTNNLPYAARIEFEGYSDQAPSGMLRVNVERVRAAIARR